MKLTFQMKRKTIFLMIVQKTMVSQIMGVIFIQHPRKDHFLRNSKNRRKKKRCTKRCKCYGKATMKKQEDSFDLFGKHTANEIRPLDIANVQRWVKFKIQEIIFQAQFNPHVQT